MANYYQKQFSSRQLLTTTLTSGLQTSVATGKFSAQTYQIRAAGGINGYLLIADSTAAATTFNGMAIAANVGGEYFAVNPGQVANFISTSSSTTANFTITEMT